MIKMIFSHFIVHISQVHMGMHVHTHIPPHTPLTAELLQENG